VPAGPAPASGAGASSSHDALGGVGSLEALEAAAALRPEPLDAAQGAKRQRVLERAARAGLLGLTPLPSDVFSAQPSARELQHLRQLRLGAKQVTFESVDSDRLQSALTHLELFMEEMPSRVPFPPEVGAGDGARLAAARYREETYRLYSASCIRRGSLQRGRLGEPIAPETIMGYCSALRALQTRDGGVNTLVKEASGVVPAMMRGVRRGRPARKAKLKRRGLRGRHLRKAAANRKFDRSSSWEARRGWALAVTGYALLARGGELGRVEKKAWDASRGLRWRDVQWHRVGRVHKDHAACTVHICAVKDREGGGERFPIPIRRRAAPGQARDPVCAYDELRAAWEEDCRLLGRQAALDTPVFRRSARGGPEAAVSTRDVRATVRTVAVAAGEPAGDFGAHSLRIGGATDMRDLLGIEKGKSLIKDRGRWKSDIFHIYTRADMAAGLEASAGMADVKSVEIEAIFSDWVDNR